MPARTVRRVVICTVASCLGAVAVTVSAGAVTPVACAKPVQAADGSYGPVLCTTGAPNRLVQAKLKLEAPRVMALSASASNTAILQAACADMSKAKASTSMLVDAYKYQFARHNWNGKHIKPARFARSLNTCSS